MIPKWLIEFAIGLVVVAALVGGWIWRENVVYRHGYDAAVSERKAADDKKLALDIAKAHDGEVKLQAKMYADAIARTKERNEYEDTIEGLRKSARAGTSGMRCPGAVVRADATPTDSASASGPSGEAGHDLLPEASSDILDTASYIRQSVLRNNALIAAYNDARATCNAK